MGFLYEPRKTFLEKIYHEQHNEGSENYCLAEMDPLHPLIQEAGDLLNDSIYEACGFTAAKEAMLEKIDGLGEIDVNRLKEIIMGAPREWDDPEKVCDADRTFHLYIEELAEQGKILKIGKEKTKLKLV
jgi:hypothetical protein